MSKQKILRFYLEDGLRSSAQAGTHNFINKIVSVVKSAGFEVAFHSNSLVERGASMTRGGYALFHMEEPTTSNGLTLRRVYHYPFWVIEPTGKRWHWQVANTRFQPEKTDPKQAKSFYRRWQNRLFDGAASETHHDGFVYVPLQGRLLERRSFQFASPIEMIHSVLSHDPKRRVIATLHPSEHYTRDEEKRLDQLQERFGHLTVQRGDMVRLLQGCDYVVTQNSSVAFNGFFFGKPCVLFARSDFHHITASVERMGIANAFEEVLTMQPDYAGYIHWFWQQMSINAGREEAEEKIAALLRLNGWPV
ncbi:MAG: hypothetical protein CML60_09250 [Rhodobacteraceae bacterium]|nr:hypothetical protein [Paracoccaceae bacterium]MBT26566.1 hypothetical protein [Paracoccaceae bacterium]